MDSIKQIYISTNLSNLENITFNYGQTYRNTILCKYTNSNYDKLINIPFTSIIDNVYINNGYTSVSSLLNYNSNTAFSVIYNISEKLKGITDCMFSTCPTLYSISNLSEDLEYIGKYAFDGCVALKYLTLPSSINEIKEFAFNGTKNLKSLDVSNITKLYNYSFAGAGIETIELNSSIKALNHYLFKDCKNLTEFVNHNINAIGEGVFCNCTNLKYVDLTNLELIFDNDTDYKEEQPNIEKEHQFISKRYEFFAFDKYGNTEFGTIVVKTIENDSIDEELSNKIKIEVITYDEDGDKVGQIFYLDPEALEDTSGDNIYVLKDENGDEIDLGVKLKGNEPVIIPVTRWRLFTNNDDEIGNIDSTLAESIKNYLKDGDPICEYNDNGDGSEIIRLLNPVTFIEYYIDGITPTGYTTTSPNKFTMLDAKQNINKYKFYSTVDHVDIITSTNDINTNIIFNEDFTECRVKLIGYPIYDRTAQYLCYYLYEPFASLRIANDPGLVYKPDTNNNAYIDNSFYVPEENKYPVYNKNYCFLGMLTNDQYLEYTTQAELDLYASRMEMNIVFDNNNEDTGLRYFMLPSSYNYNQWDLGDDNIENVRADIQEIIDNIIAYKNGGTIGDESEENNSVYYKFSLSNLNYKNNKIKLPDLLFAGCVSLDNNNIVRVGNYNPELSSVLISFRNETDSTGKYNLGTWVDTISLNNYTPSLNDYEYTFKWKVLNINGTKYIYIILGNTNYYISETFDTSYHRVLSNNLETTSISDVFVTNLIDDQTSIFDIDITENVYDIKLPNYQKDKYDTYQLLDSINEIGNSTFMNCISFENIYNQFTSIGNYGFKDCINLKSIDLSKTENIGDYALQNCQLIEEVDLNLLLENSSEGIFSGCSNLKNVNNLKVNNITNYMFKNCNNLENINLNNITSISKEAFFNNYTLILDESNNIDKVTYIGDYAFYNCRNIQKLKLSNNIDYLGIGVFKGCTSLKSIILPECITNLTNELFSGCSNLESLIFSSPITEEFNLSGIDYCDNLSSIHIPDGGRYSTPDDQYILDTTTNTIIYICKNLSVVDININGTIKISDSALNNCQSSIIKISDNTQINNLNSNTFKGIKNHSYHVLINKLHNQYNEVKELIGNRHIYYV